MTTTTTIPEIERAVITLLARQHAQHALVRGWVTTLITDVNESRRLDQFVEETDLPALLNRAWHSYEDEDEDGNPITRVAEEYHTRVDVEQALAAAGMYCPPAGHKLFDDSLYGETLDLRALTAVRQDGESDEDYDYTRRIVQFQRSTDSAIVRLAGQLARFRRDGRPVGDQTTYIGGGSSMGQFAVTTSLAAAVVEYHERILGAYLADAAR